MKCERCGSKNNVSFTGEEGCKNTPENLPGGYAWLCEKCDDEVWDEEMENMYPRRIAELQGFKKAKLAEIAGKEPTDEDQKYLAEIEVELDHLLNSPSI